MKGIIGKLMGFVLLAGFFFGLFVLVFAPIEMLKKAKAESWPSRKGVITLSYASRNPGSRWSNPNPGYWKAEICGNYIDSGERFCISRVRCIDPKVPVTEAEIEKAFTAKSRIILPKGSSIMVIQSGAMIPDDVMVKGLEKYYNVSVFTGVPGEGGTRCRRHAARSRIDMACEFL
jgi:hypothetical protein